MASSLDTQRLGAVFQSRPDILAGIKKAADTPARVTLFNDIAAFVSDQLATGPEPSAKRRRIDANGASAPSSGSSGTSGLSAADDPVVLEIKDISVSIPQRKKYDLCFTKNFLYARAPGTTAPVPGIVYAWKDIEYAFYLPVPEKAQQQYNYVLFPRHTALASLTKSAPAPEAEPLVFTVSGGAPKPGSVAGALAAEAAAVGDTYGALLGWALGTHLRAGGAPAEVVSADPRVFRSVARQAHRPAEAAVHVKAFRGSKDGYLFLLPTGILWGFKKPLLFAPLERVAAVSYTSVLQRTFNVVVEVFTGDAAADAADAADADQTAEIEFAMLDQEDYQGIDETYVRRHGLQDRSLAERRKAKIELTENLKEAKRKAEGGDGGVETANGGGVGGGDGMTELEKAHLEAEQQLQDDEDEDEEDYDPGSEGESEGSGSSDDDDDDDDDDDEEDEGEDEDGADDD